jgi:phage N-6-adenine-methyltransferase
VVIASHRFNNDLRYRDGEHPNQRQLTPSYVLEPVRLALGGIIGLDPCTEPDNPVGADHFYTVDDDGLAQPWCESGWWPSVYVNPPYSRAKEPWVEACIAAGARDQRVVLLIPAHTDTRIFHEAMETATATCFIKGRVKFGVLRKNRRQEAASHPSALIGWNTDLAPCSVLGKVIDLSRSDQSSNDAPVESAPIGPAVVEES